MKNSKTLVLYLALVIITAALLIPPLRVTAAGGTTSITVTKYDANGNVVGAPRNVTWEWMRDNLPVCGDGVTHYYFQGPTFDESNRDALWDPTETVNVDSRDYGAIKGTDVKDLCELVGGASAGDTIKIKAADNFSKWFDYEDIYNPEPEQGKIAVTWYTAGTAEGTGGYVPDYGTGMRLNFLPETTNPDDKFVFGLWEQHEYLPASRWHYYYDGKYWPSSSGLSVKNISKIEIYQPNLVSCDASGNPKDSFIAGEKVYVKGSGLNKNASFKVWIQDEPVLMQPLNVLERPVGNYMFKTDNDPSGTQESVTTDASGDFNPVEIWSIDTTAAGHKYDIVVDNQVTGTVGKYDGYTAGATTNSDFIDAPGWQGFSVGAGAPATPPSSSSASHLGSTNPKTIVSLPVSAEFIIPTIGISLDKASLAYGEIIKGEDSKKETVTITNTGNRTVKITLEIQGEDVDASSFYHQSLYIDDVIYDETASIARISPAQTKELQTQLKVPMAWNKPGVHKATFIFWAEAQ